MSSRPVPPRPSRSTTAARRSWLHRWLGRSPEPSPRGRLRLEQLEPRQLLAGDLAWLITDGSESNQSGGSVEAAAFNTTTLQGEGEAGETADDLVAFAKALKDVGVTFYGAAWCAACTAQKELFSDGARELPFVEVTNPDRTLNAVGVANDIEVFPTWEFPDSTRATGVLSLQEISDRAGVPIPQGASPSFAPVGDQFVGIGSPLHLPINAYDPNGQPLTTTVTVGDPSLLEATVLEGNRSLRMVIEGYGTMVFELFEDRASRPAERIIELTQAGFYDGVTFHRVIDNFMIQGGDPTGTGAGGSDLGTFDDHFHPDLQHNRAGVLSYAKSLDDTNDSQFFITAGPTRHLDFNHSIFGQLVEGDAVRQAISQTAVTNSRPDVDVVIDRFEVFQDDVNSVLMLRPTGNGTGVTDVTITVTDPDGNTFTEVIQVQVGADDFNTPPFLMDIPPVSAPAGTPATFTLEAMDVEGDPFVFEALVTDNSGATATVDQATGLVTVTPPAGFSGTVMIEVAVRDESVPSSSNPSVRSQTMDTQQVPIVFGEETPETPSAPTSISLDAASDTGSSDSDGITNAESLTFNVGGVTAGATVELLVDDIVIGSGTATDSSITITTDQLADLGDGTYAVRARQTVDDQTSPLSASTTVILDTTPPVPSETLVPSQATVGTAYHANLQHPEEGSGLQYSLVAAPDGMTIHASSGQIAWTPSAAQAGAQAFTVVLSDVAGNTTEQTFNVSVGADPTVNFNLDVTDLDGNPISVIGVGEEFFVQVLVRDLRGAGAQGVFSAYLDLLFDGSLVETVGENPFTYGSDYNVSRSGTVGENRIADLGALTSNIGGLGDSELQLVRVHMRAIGAGAFTLATEPANDPNSEVLLFDDDEQVENERIRFGSVNVETAHRLEAVDDNFTVDENSSQNHLDVLENDTFIPEDGVSLQITDVSSTSAGATVTIGSGNQHLLYTPPAGFRGVDVFTYTVTHGDLTSEATVVVNVNPENGGPIAVNDAFTVVQGAEAAEFDVLANDSHPVSGETLTLDSVGTPSAGGTVSISNDGTRLVYQPAAGFSGTETVTYTVRDSQGVTAQATVTFQVTEADVPPPAPDHSARVVKGSSATTVFSVDSISGSGSAVAGLEFTAVGETSAGGTVSIANDGRVIRYTPPSSTFLGEDSFSYTVTNAAGLSTTGTLSVEVVDYVPRSFDLIFNNGTGGFAALGSIQPVLRGTSELGDDVEVTGTVDPATGRVVFADQPPGEYVIEIPAIPFLIGGETPRQIPVQSGHDDSDATFELELGGLRPEYISIRDFLGNTPRQALLVAAGAGQSHLWINGTSAIDTMTNPQVTLSEDGQEVIIEGVDGNGTNQQSTLAANDPRIQVRGRSDGFQLLRIDVSSGAATNGAQASAMAASGNNELAGMTEQELQAMLGGLSGEGEGTPAPAPAATSSVVPLSTSIPLGSNLQSWLGRTGAPLTAEGAAAVDSAMDDLLPQLQLQGSAAETLAETAGNEADSAAIDEAISTLGDDAPPKS